MLKSVPTERTVNPDDANVITYSRFIDVLSTWNQISHEQILRYANEIWGTRDWTVSNDNIVVPLSQARGEIENGV